MKRYIIVLISLILLTACGKKQDTNKDMEQIYTEEGIPVRQIEVQPTTFRSELHYNANLNGLEESTAQAMVSEIVGKINAKVGDRVTKK